MSTETEWVVTSSVLAWTRAMMFAKNSALTTTVEKG